MKIIGIIPARYGSSRFPGKPLAELQDKPLIMHVYHRAVKASVLSDLFVATDDVRIQSAVEELGGKAVMTRTDHVSGTDRLAEAAEKLEADIIVNIQGDEPLIESDMINQVTQPLIELERIPMATLKKKIVNADELENPNVVKVIVDEEDFALYFSRSLIPHPKKGYKTIMKLNEVVDVQPPFYKHIGIYAYRKHFLMKFTKLPVGCLEQIEELEQLRALEYGYRIKVIETKYDTIAVDTTEDLERVKELLKQNKV